MQRTLASHLRASTRTPMPPPEVLINGHGFEVRNTCIGNKQHGEKRVQKRVNTTTGKDGGGNCTLQTLGEENSSQLHNRFPLFRFKNVDTFLSHELYHQTCRLTVLRTTLTYKDNKKKAEEKENNEIAKTSLQY